MLSELTKKVFAYDPALDLSLDPRDRKEELIERINRGKDGLGNFAEKMATQKYIRPSSYKAGIQEVVVLMLALEDILRNDKYEEYAPKLKELEEGYLKLREDLYRGEKEYLASGQRLEILNEGANIINEYNFVLSKIKILKGEFSGKTLFN